MSVSLAKASAVHASDAPGCTVLLPSGTPVLVCWPEVFPHDPAYVTLHGQTLPDKLWHAETIRANRALPLLPDEDTAPSLSARLRYLSAR